MKDRKVNTRCFLALSFAAVVLALAFTFNHIHAQGSTGSELARLPFKRHMNLILVEARVSNSKPLKLLVDTGVSSLILDTQAADTLDLNLGNVRKSRTTSKKGELSIRNAANVEYEFGTLKTKFRLVQVMQFQKTARVFAGETVHGILGHPFFEAFTVEVNYESQEMVLHDPAKYKYAGKGASLNLEFDRKVANLPFVQTTLESKKGVKHEIRMLVDSGGGVLSTCGLGGNKVINATIPEDAVKIPTMSATGLADSAADTTHKSFVTRLAELHIGPYSLSRPIVGCTSVPEVSLFGAEVLHRFHVVFDYRRHRMILEPNKWFRDEAMTDCSGMMIVASERDIATRRVQYVSPGTPAGIAGLKAGDELITINGDPSSIQDLHATRKLFFIAGRKHVLGVRRGSQKLSIELTTRNLFE